MDKDLPNLDERASICPVDHSTRDAWLRTEEGRTKPKVTASSTTTCSSAVIDQPILSTPTETSGKGLKIQREVSSIPRSQPAGSAAEVSNKPQKVPSNWIYPSEQMFFNAMARKNWKPNAEDMHTIVPIHNAVNEKAWAEIKKWEHGTGSDKCGGPKLVSFSGDAKKLTPKARLFMLLGYQAPFDRHDWVVDRCGKRIEYVIDFYSGKRDPGNPLVPSFYLDVRPKLSLEGMWMRTQRWVTTFWE